MKTFLAASLFLYAVGPACGQTAQPADQWRPDDSVRRFAEAAKKIALTASSPSGESEAAPACAAPSPGPDEKENTECQASLDMPCGVMGVLCAQKIPEALNPQTSEPAPPINTGFRSLGEPGSTGTIDGPARKGNGTFTVVSNTAYEMSMEIRTGYIDGTVTLARDPQTGKDTMRFLGKQFKSGSWGPLQDKTAEMILRYDPQKDKGSINWQEDGKWKSERFWNEGAKAMVIEFGGGWDHRFTRD